MIRSPLSRRLWLILLLAVPLFLAGGHALLWRWMAGQIETAFAAWSEAREAQGWTIAHGPPLRGGWPLAATLTLPEIRVIGGAATIPGGVDWSVGSVTLRVALPRLGELEVEPAGLQRLALGDMAIPFTADRMLAVLALEPGVPPREGRFLADRLRIGLVAGALELRSLAGQVTTRASATEAEPALTLALEARDLMLPMAGPLGRSIAEARAELTMTGPVPGGRLPARRAETWRDGGGSIDVQVLSLHWGPLVLEAAATVALDDRLQPMGAGSLQVVGAAEALTALAATGVITPGAAVTAQAFAAMLAQPGPDGGPPRIDVPLTLDNRTLAISRIPLVRMPRLDWPLP